MDIETYVREARRFDNHQDARVVESLAHGLAAEIGEVWGCVLDRDHGPNLLHELGDVAWNVARLADEVGLRPAELLRYAWGPAEGVEDAAGELVRRGAKISGLLEKWLRTTPPPWELKSEIAHYLHPTWQALTRCSGWFGYRMDHVMQANIDKLTRRYAERGLPVKEAS